MSRAGILVVLFTITPIAIAIPALAGIWQDPGYRTDEVRPNVYVIRGAGANTTVFTGTEGIVIIDTKAGDHSKALRASIAKLSKDRLRYLINTHAHRENCAGNKSFPATVPIIAHDSCDTRMRADGLRGADLSFAQRLSLRFDDETITCHHKGLGHTDGDVIVHFESAEVLVLGGLVANGVHPALLPEHGCDIFRWLDVLREIKSSFDSTTLTVVPGDGPPGGMDLVSDQITYLESILDAMREAHRHGLDRAEALVSAEGLRVKYAHLKGTHFESNLETIYDRLAGR